MLGGLNPRPVAFSTGKIPCFDSSSGSAFKSPVPVLACLIACCVEKDHNTNSPYIFASFDLVDLTMMFFSFCLICKETACWWVCLSEFSSELVIHGWD